MFLSLCQQDSSGGGLSEVKVWSPDKLDSRGRPLCLRSLAPDPRPGQGSQRQSQASKHGSGRGQMPRVTALAVHPNLSLMAVGCSDGSIILYRGRTLSSKYKINIAISSRSCTYTDSLAIRGREVCLKCSRLDIHNIIFNALLYQSCILWSVDIPS